jgi:hypothetical protein
MHPVGTLTGVMRDASNRVVQTQPRGIHPAAAVPHAEAPSPTGAPALQPVPQCGSARQGAPQQRCSACMGARCQKGGCIHCCPPSSTNTQVGCKQATAPAILGHQRLMPVLPGIHCAATATQRPRKQVFAASPTPQPTCWAPPPADTHTAAGLLPRGALLIAAIAS